MGMDLFGLNPQLVGEKPEKPANWDSLTEYERGLHDIDVNIWESNNPGVYFRASISLWRPLHAICDMAIYIAELPFDTKGWEKNHGCGLKTQLDCDMLADAIDLYMMLNKADMFDMDDTMYLCLGSWVTIDNRFLEREIQDKLNQDYPKGTILYRGVVLEDGGLVWPSNSCPLYYINNFTTFLRKCGGFQIW